jgi:hypothetical protein
MQSFGYDFHGSTKLSILAFPPDNLNPNRRTFQPISDLRVPFETLSYYS